MMKKRGGDKILQQQILDETAKSKLKYQTLLTEFFQLQKESVSRKRKLRAANQRKNVLLSEVRFLRRRLRYLKKNHPSAIEQTRNIHNQNTNMELESRSGETEFSDLVPAPSMNNPNPMHEGEDRKQEEEEIVKKEHTQVNIPKNYFLDEEKLGNNKDESWHNQVPVEI